MSLEVYYSQEFRRAYKKLPVNIQALVKQRGALFSDSPFHSSLRTHKLTGALHGLWAFSVNQKIRVIFEFQGSQHVLLHSVGDHSLYRKR